jgi:hypothetical protein
MNLKILALCAVGVSLLAIGFAAQSIMLSAGPELWYQHHSYLVSEDAVSKSKTLIDKAVAAGYTGALFWDSSFFMMGNPDWDPDNEDRLKEVLKYARKRRLKVVAEAAAFGWSNDTLAANPNWAEAQRVIGTQFQVAADGKTLQLKSGSAGLLNGDFESGQTAWFDLGDPNVSIGSDAYSGKGALTIVDPPGNARVRQKFAVKPWRQYHLSFDYKAAGAGIGSPMVVVSDGSNLEKGRLTVYLHESAGWSDLHYLLNSGDSNELVIYLGVWGGAKGTVKFDDIKLEETGLVWLAHREGAPFKLYDPQNPSQVYAAGADYNEVIDPDMLPHRPSFHNVFHWPPPFTLPKTTQLKPGQIVAADYYAATPLPHETQMGMCLTEPGVYQWLAKNAHEMKKVLPAESNLMFGYDEMRQANSCLSCRSKNLSPGELLAWSLGKTHGIYRNTLPGTSFWIWSDMFDPNHNAHNNYYYAEGDFAGSWKGVPPDISVLNWNLDHLKQSLTWFSGLNPDQPIPHRQIIAGFYERPDAAGEARRELREAAGIPGIRGLMYTTWIDDYSKLQTYADAVRAAWPDYVASLPKE